jgi:hypothetical protein
MLRVLFQSPAILDEIATVAHCSGHFGNQCDYKRARDEVERLSDFDLHQICLEYPSLEKFSLDREALYNSPKMTLLQELLPKLVVSDVLIILKEFSDDDGDNGDLDDADDDDIVTIAFSQKDIECCCLVNGLAFSTF